jgi:hypothetical protein
MAIRAGDFDADLETEDGRARVRCPLSLHLLAMSPCLAYAICQPC